MKNPSSSDEEPDRVSRERQRLSPRRRLLEKAANTVDGDRDKEYGGPEQSFTTIARVWTVLKGVEFTATDVAMMMAGLKLARLSNIDSWVDLAGYAACGFEIVDAQDPRANTLE
jgi:hypothetical protein